MQLSVLMKIVVQLMLQFALSNDRKIRYDLFTYQHQMVILVILSFHMCIYRFTEKSVCETLKCFS